MSLLVLAPKPPQKLREQAEAIGGLDGQRYPAPMANYAFYTYLVYAVERYEQENGLLWAETAGYLFGHQADVWYENNRFLLDYTLNHALDIVRNEIQKITKLAEILERGALAGGLQQKQWADLKKACPYLGNGSKPFLRETQKITNAKTTPQPIFGDKKRMPIAYLSKSKVTPNNLLRS